MSYRINESTIRNFVGVASFVGGLICFAFSSVYDHSFGKLGSRGRLVYAGISLIIFGLIWCVKRIRAPEIERFQIVVQATLFFAICLLSVELDKLVPGKSDFLGIISYGLFALMSVSKSRRSELGFETGFSSFFVSLFSEQLYKTNKKLLPVALAVCLAAILLRHPLQSDDNDEYYDVEAPYSPRQNLLPTTNRQDNNEAESSQAAMLLSPRIGQVSEGSNQQNRERGETRSSFSNGNHGEEELLLSETVPEADSHEYLNVEAQNAPEESLSSTNNAQNIQEESSEAVSEENISDGGEQEEDIIAHLPDESPYPAGQRPVSSIMPGSPPQPPRRRLTTRETAGQGLPGLPPSPEHPRRRRVRVRMTPAIQNFLSSLGDLPRRWRPPHPPVFFF